MLCSECQLAEPMQEKMKSQIDEDVEMILKMALENDKWFQAHKGKCTMQNGLDLGRSQVIHSKKSKVTSALKKVMTVGYFGFVKSLQLIKQQFWWPLL